MPEVFICNGRIRVPSPYPEFTVIQAASTTDDNPLFVLDTGDETVSVYEALCKGDVTGFILISGGNSVGNFHNAKQVEAVYRDLAEDPDIEVVVEVEPDFGQPRHWGILKEWQALECDGPWLFGIESHPGTPRGETVIHWLPVERLKVLSVSPINQPRDRHHES